ncbi:hypothetical protein [Endozoicomonas sp. SCSIO W0465]|uniref:hypothetical protein n=1 Tax=Endozoicomonas sp. SCSIO W0465 TaxID=2918516 RepID=UPI002074F154|nr:hypothetical protein [Endozoicomonas sp. SCSIO W0465]USE35369.1 hypothetical protein MJO57_25225 [Endozoicomonas sp. SCSIO W0465]
MPHIHGAPFIPSISQLLSTGAQPSAFAPFTDPTLAAATDIAPPRESIPDIDYGSIVQQIISTSNLSRIWSLQSIDHLTQCFDLKIKTKVITLLEDPSKFSQLQPLRQQIAEHMEYLRNFCNEHGGDFNTVETAIANHVAQQAEKVANIEKRNLISHWLGWDHNEVDQLAGITLTDTYRACKSDKHLADSVRAKLSHLIELAEIPPEFRERYTVEIDYQQAPYETEGRFLIRVPDGNCALGYGLFDLLFSQNLLHDGDADYDGKTGFALNKNQMIKLSEHLEELNKWYDDFLCIVGDLLGVEDDISGDSADQFVSIGKKSMAEMLRNPLRMTAMCQHLISSLPPEQPVVLFNTLSINLNRHVDRDYLKEKFESTYRELAMYGSNGEPKQFLRGTYSTNLNVEQLRLICPHLNKLLKLQQLLTEFTNTRSLRSAVDLLKEWGMSELDSLKSYKTALIYEIYQQIKGTNNQQELDSIRNAMANIQHISGIESTSLERCHAILRDHSVCYFRNPTNQPVIDEERFYDIYGDNERDVMYAGRQRHRNIRALCQTLRGCHAYQQYQASNPGIDGALAALERNFIDRLNRYSGMRELGSSGRRMVDESVEYFETFVSQLYYAVLYRLTDHSINNALDNLAAIVGNDLEGCNQGFSGRIQSLLLPLVSGSNNQIKDCIQQFLQDSVTASLARAIGDSSESSMAARCQEEVNRFVGLSIVSGRAQTATVAYANLSHESKQTIDHLVHSYYTPVLLYQHAYRFVSDEFWRLNHERSDDDIYQLMHLLGFGTDQSLGADNETYREAIDRQYRVRGNALNRWQYALFQQDLPKHLVAYLVKEQFIEAKRANENDGLYIHRETSQGSDSELIAPPRRTFATGCTTESGPSEANRQFGFQPESRMAQAGYRVETS